MSNAAPPRLEARGLSKTYPDGAVRALASVDVSIAVGEYVAIMGPSGSGKSTLLNMLGALDSPDSGSVFFDGQEIAALPDIDRFRAEKLGFVFQSFYLLPTLTAVENVQVPMFDVERSGSRRAARAKELLEAVAMSHRANHLPIQLSVGERQRVAIARSLANRPSLLLADEPTGNLDSASASGILDLFDRLHREQKMTLVVVTHSDEVARRAGRVIRVRDGRVESAVSTSP